MATNSLQNRPQGASRRFRQFLHLLVLGGIMTLVPSGVKAQISLTTATPSNTQDFNSASLADNALPSNWRITNCVTFATVGTANTGQAVLTFASATLPGVSTGMLVSGSASIPTNTYVLSIALGSPNSTVTLSTNIITSNIVAATTIVFTSGSGTLSGSPNLPNYANSGNKLSSNNNASALNAAGNSYMYYSDVTGPYDRAIGFQSSASFVTPNSIMARYSNGSSTTPITSLSVTFTRKKIADTLRFIDLASAKSVVEKCTIYDNWQTRAILQRPRPFAYLIPANQRRAIQNLKFLGISLDSLRTSQKVAVQVFTGTQQQNSEDPTLSEDDSVAAAKPSGVLEKEMEFPAGTYVVYMNQRKANLLPELLEPEAENGFLSNRTIQMPTDALYPVYRYMLPQKLN